MKSCKAYDVHYRGGMRYCSSHYCYSSGTAYPIKLYYIFIIRNLKFKGFRGGELEGKK